VLAVGAEDRPADPRIGLAVLVIEYDILLAALLDAIRTARAIGAEGQRAGNDVFEPAIDLAGLATDHRDIVEAARLGDIGDVLAVGAEGNLALDLVELQSVLLAIVEDKGLVLARLPDVADLAPRTEEDRVERDRVQRQIAGGLFAVDRLCPEDLLVAHFHAKHQPFAVGREVDHPVGIVERLARFAVEDEVFVQAAGVLAGEVGDVLAIRAEERAEQDLVVSGFLFDAVHDDRGPFIGNVHGVAPVLAVRAEAERIVAHVFRVLLRLTIDRDLVLGHEPSRVFAIGADPERRLHFVVGGQVHFPERLFGDGALQGLFLGSQHVASERRERREENRQQLEKVDAHEHGIGSG